MMTMGTQDWGWRQLKSSELANLLGTGPTVKRDECKPVFESSADAPWMQCGKYVQILST